MIARHLQQGEALPDGLMRGLDQLGTLDTYWTWVVENEVGLIGVLVASPVYGMVLILKLNMHSQAPNTAIVLLLRKFLEEIKARSMKGYLVWFDQDRPEEKRLLTIAQKAGETFCFNATLLAGKIPEGW